MPRTSRLPVSVRAVLLVAAALVARPAAADASPADASPAETPDAFHDAASRADGEACFARLTEDAVFLGTDPGERWTRAEFRASCEPYFSRGRGWTYVPSDRHVAIPAEGSLAWFDEALDNEHYGRCRGTGVLRRAEGRWRIVQYALSIPIPNDLAGEAVAMIRAGDAAADHRDLDALLEQLHATISGDAGGERDWDRFRALFTDDATLAVVGPPREGDAGPRSRRTLTVEQYVTGAARMSAARGFHGRQVSRRVVRHGHIAHVFSVYESRASADDAEPRDRGINSIQLVDTGDGWRIVSMLWEAERTAGPVADATASSRPADE